jgi:hypothetical protein
MSSDDTADYDIIMETFWPQVKRSSSPALEGAGRRLVRKCTAGVRRKLYHHGREARTRRRAARAEQGREEDGGNPINRYDLAQRDKLTVNPDGSVDVYKNITVGRHTKFGFDKGKQAFILDDPEGNSWAMKSFSLITHPDQKFEEAGTLGGRLKLPPGWKFRAPVLEQDLVLTPDKNGIAHITQDDFGNTYDRVGGAYSNYKP